MKLATFTDDKKHIVTLQEDLNTLRQFLEKIHPLSPALWEDLSGYWQPVVYKRKTILTAAGETERYLYFVVEGIQRAFYTTLEGRQETTVIFTYPPSFSGVPESFLKQTPSAFYLETLTASRLLRIGYDSFREVREKHPSFNDLLFRMMLEAFEGLLLRHAQMQCFNAEEKFRTFLTRSPHMLNLVPHKYLASYLGIDPSTFSRLLTTVKL